MYLFSQMLLFVLAAGLIGLLAGWFFGRCRCEADELRTQFAAAEAAWRKDASDLRARLAAASVGASALAVGAGLAEDESEAAQSARLGLQTEVQTLKDKLAAAETARTEAQGLLARAQAEAGDYKTKLAAMPNVAEAESDWRRRLEAADKARSEAEAARQAAEAEAKGLAAKLQATPDPTQIEAAWRERVRTAEAASEGARARATELESRIKALEAKSAAPKAATDPQGLIGVAGAALAGAAAGAGFSNAQFTPSSLASFDSAELEKAVLAAGDGKKPVGLIAPVGGTADDLKEIGGVGPVLETWLHQHGIFHFWQIAVMEAPQLAWIAENLPQFGSRVYREHWVRQAIHLARGERPDGK